MNDVAFNFPFAFELREAGSLLGAGNRAIHEMREACGFGGIRHSFALTDFALEPGFSKALD